MVAESTININVDHLRTSTSNDEPPHGRRLDDEQQFLLLIESVELLLICFVSNEETPLAATLSRCVR